MNCLLEKSGLVIKRETLNRYIDILLSSKVLYCCDRFDMKSRKTLQGEKKYYLADTSFYFALNTDNRINFEPALENMVYVYARSLDYSVSVGRIGRLECDFILRDNNLNYSYVQVAYTINESKATEDREYAPLESETIRICIWENVLREYEGIWPLISERMPCGNHAKSRRRRGGLCIRSGPLPLRPSADFCCVKRFKE